VKSARPAILVGLLLLCGVGILVYFINIAGRKGLGKSESYLVHVHFPDASGLASRSRVVISGIDIGKIDSVRLEKGKAVVTIRISDQYPLYEDASVLKRASSLISDDALLDIDPGTEGKPRIPNDGWITNVRTAPSMDQVMASVQKITDDVQKVTSSLAGSVGTPEGKESVETILKQLAQTSVEINKASAKSAAQIAQILANLTKITGDVRALVPAQEKQIVAILENIKQITEQTKSTIGMVHDIVNGQQGQVTGAMGQVRDTLGKLDATVGSVEKVAEGVEKGEGTVGKLLRDQDLAARVANTVKAATDYFDRLTGLKLEVGFRAELHVQPTLPKGVDWPSIEQIGVKIMPSGSSRYIGVDLVSDTQGTVSHNVQLLNNEPLVTDTYAQALAVNAYLAQRWGPSTWRVGLIESTGGIGVDVDVVPKILSMHVDAFNFTPPNGLLPRVKTYAQFTFDKYFDIYAGGDDLLNGPQASPDPHGILTPPGRSAFVGAGFHFGDEDLKAILSTTGVPKL
jgi:phospholipid/cholesterol/gamma-HCH transport system substrate-binding protein